MIGIDGATSGRTDGPCVGLDRRSWGNGDAMTVERVLVIAVLVLLVLFLLTRVA
jgi:hypothetical protein